MLAVDGREKGLCVFDDFCLPFTFPLFLDGRFYDFRNFWGKSLTSPGAAGFLSCGRSFSYACTLVPHRDTDLFPLDPGLPGDPLSNRMRQKHEVPVLGRAGQRPSLAEPRHHRRRQLPSNPASSWP